LISTFLLTLSSDVYHHKQLVIDTYNRK
jgi:hypothetical protein